jgi:hypothetical protein
MNAHSTGCVHSATGHRNLVQALQYPMQSAFRPTNTEDAMKRPAPALLLITLMFPGLSGADEPASAQSWQVTRLFEPSENDLASENKGKVIIYHGLTDKTVERALDEEFDRIESFMFTGTVVTDDSGEPARDPETDIVMTEDDGC